MIGIDYHRPHGSFQLGRLPQYALVNAPCEVWLIRYPPEGAPTGATEEPTAAAAPGAGRDERGDAR